MAPLPSPSTTRRADTARSTSATALEAVVGKGDVGPAAVGEVRARFWGERRREISHGVKLPAAITAREFLTTDQFLVGDNDSISYSGSDPKHSKNPRVRAILQTTTIFFRIDLPKIRAIRSTLVESSHVVQLQMQQASSLPYRPEHLRRRGEWLLELQQRPRRVQLSRPLLWIAWLLWRSRSGSSLAQ